MNGCKVVREIFYFEEYAKSTLFHLKNEHYVSLEKDLIYLDLLFHFEKTEGFTNLNCIYSLDPKIQIVLDLIEMPTM